MRRRSRVWGFIRTSTDALLIVTAVFIAWYVRYEIQANLTLGEGFFYYPFSAYVPLAVILTALTLVILRFEGFYTLARGRSYPDELYTILNGTTTAILLVMAFTFFVRPLVFSRALYVYAALLIDVVLAASRALQRITYAYWRKRGKGVDRVLIVGAGELGRALMRNIVAKPDLAYQVIGFVDDDPERGCTDIGRFKAFGPTAILPALLRELSVDEVIITLPWTAREKIINTIELCQRWEVAAKVVPDMFQLSLSRVEIDDVGGVPLLSVRETKLGLVDSAIKRLMDLAVGSVLLFMFAPIMLLIAILIRLDSPGSIIFSQKRVGRGGRTFSAFKFRSMREGAEEERDQLSKLNEATGPLFKIRNDPRRTRLGRFIRRTSLDELPQFFNVLRGEISLVGPRAPLPTEVAQYREWHKRRLDVPQGLTGLSQVSGRSELTFDEMVMLDIYYIENWSPWLDLWILLKTIPTVLLARGAY
jgi:exopolysaccharide biosynthesis polyprenyl glycosylphosphotransferase